MSNQAVAASTTADKTSKSPPIKTRTEKHERLVHLLHEAMSRKISEKLAAREKERVAKEEKKEERKEEGGEGDRAASESPTSTLSSSGEREGVYTLYADSLDSGDESGEHHMIVTC